MPKSYLKNPTWDDIRRNEEEIKLLFRRRDIKADEANRMRLELDKSGKLTYPATQKESTRQDIPTYRYEQGKFIKGKGRQENEGMRYRSGVDNELVTNPEGLLNISPTDTTEALRKQQEIRSPLIQTGKRSQLLEYDVPREPIDYSRKRQPLPLLGKFNKGTGKIEFYDPSTTVDDIIDPKQILNWGYKPPDEPSQKPSQGDGTKDQTEGEEEQKPLQWEQRWWINQQDKKLQPLNEKMSYGQELNEKETKYYNSVVDSLNKRFPTLQVERIENVSDPEEMKQKSGSFYDKVKNFGSALFGGNKSTGMVRVKSSDGKVWTIPQSKLKQAKELDPGLTEE